MTQPQSPAPNNKEQVDIALEAAWNEARQRFIAGFPKRSDSIGYLVGLVATFGKQGPVAALREIVHKTAGLAGTVGFPTVTEKARALEELVDTVGEKGLDVSLANRLYEGMEEGFSTDLAHPPKWVDSVQKSEQHQRIMLVEDDADQREVVSMHLQSAGYEIIPVATGDVAVDMAREHRPALVLLDCNLPGLDGYSVCRLIRLDPDLAETPVIFMTIRSSLDDKLAGLILGADDYLIKPVDMTELTLRIQLLLARRGSRKPAPVLVKTPVLPIDNKDLDFDSFAAVARQRLAENPAVLALVRVPERRLAETYAALRAETRNMDVVACHGPMHVVVLMVGMPTLRVAERLLDTINRIGPGVPPRFHIGLANSGPAGSTQFETLLKEADEAVAVARQRATLLVAAGEELPAVAETRRRGTVVLADDDPEVARLIDAQLRAAGYDTVVCADGSQAIAAVEKHRPDVVILDLMMPRMSGFDVLTKIRGHAGRPRTIVLSSRGREQDVTRAFALDADDYMTKPFSPHELLARIERLTR